MPWGVWRKEHAETHGESACALNPHAWLSVKGGARRKVIEWGGRKGYHTRGKVRWEGVKRGKLAGVPRPHPQRAESAPRAQRFVSASPRSRQSKTHASSPSARQSHSLFVSGEEPRRRADAQPGRKTTENAGSWGWRTGQMKGSERGSDDWQLCSGRCAF